MSSSRFKTEPVGTLRGRVTLPSEHQSQVQPAPVIMCLWDPEHVTSLIPVCEVGISPVTVQGCWVSTGLVLWELSRHGLLPPQWGWAWPGAPIPFLESPPPCPSYPLVCEIKWAFLEKEFF